MSMQLEALINSYVVEDDPVTAQKLALELVKSGSLLQIVKGLENPLTQEDGLVRAKATQCLTDVVKCNDSLIAQELLVLTVFLSDRLHDQESISAAADGLNALCTKSGFRIPNDDDEEFWSKLKAIDMVHLDLEVRYRVFQLLNKLAAKPSVSFVDTFVALAGGEKDPRNLMLNLGISRHILETIGSELPKEKRSEIYDITFCYFPIKFHPPKDMPYNITADEIREALSRTLSSPPIAEWVIPGLISKLTAVNINVKLDALATLDRCLSNVKASEGLHEYWRPVWEGIKFEIFHGTTESESYKPAIKIISKFVDIPEFLEDLLSEFKVESIPKPKLYQICHLVVAISANEETWQVLAPTAIEKCYEHVTALNLFLTTSYPIPHNDMVFQALLTALANGEKKDSLYGLTRFALSPNGGEYVPLIVQTLTTESAYTFLSELAPFHSSVLKEYCLPQLLSQMPGSLNALGEICCVKALVHTLTVRLLSRLDFEIIESSPGSPTPLELLNTLIVATSHLDSPNDFIGYDRVLLPPLLEKFKQANSSFSASQTSDRIINAACVLIERAARGITAERQASYVTEMVQNIGHVHFHLVLSGLASMKEFPFEHGFVQSYVIPKLSTAPGILERAAYLRLIALVANKWPAEISPESGSIETYCEDLQSTISSSNDPLAIEIFIWLTKGLIFRNDTKGFAYAAFLTENAPSNPIIAKAYGALVADDRILTKENVCTVRPLFRQRMFVSSLSKLATHSESTASLVALSSLLKYTPRAVVTGHFDQILPMLVSSLNTNVPHLQETALQSLESSLPQSAESLESQLDLLIPRFLEIASSASSTNARVLALKTIISLRSAIPEKMTRFKTTILDDMELVLGDKKRDVRKYAVKCRQIFY